MVLYLILFRRYTESMYAKSPVYNTQDLEHHEFYCFDWIGNLTLYLPKDKTIKK